MDKGIDVIVMAGGTRLNLLSRMYYIIKNGIQDLYHYGHAHISETDYKSLKKVRGSIDGNITERPFIEYTLHNLQNTPEVERIFIVGPKKELEQELSDKINRYYTKVVEIVEQTSNFGGNAKKGYQKAGDTGLKKFITCDSPTTSPIEISEDIKLTKIYEAQGFKLIYPIISQRVIESDSHFSVLKKRPYFRIIADNMNEIEIDAEIIHDQHKREGFRIGSMMTADLSSLDGTLIEEFYQLRKFLRPTTIRTIADIFKKQEDIKEIIDKAIPEYKDKNLLSKLYHWYQQGITQSDIERIIDIFITSRTPNIDSFKTKIIQLSNAGSTYDGDTHGDIEEIKRMITK